MAVGIADSLRRRHRGYSGARPDVVRLVPDGVKRVLDVGCGAGMTAGLLRERNAGVEIHGVEPDATLAGLARTQGVQVLEGRFDDPSIPDALARGSRFDVILLADVLEHMAEPGEALVTARSLLAPGGVIVTSIPNVRHVSTFTALAFAGRWPRRTRGIHDATHLRWFTRADILDLGTGAGFEVVREARNLRLVESQAWTMVPARLLDFWPFRGFYTFQYLHLWRPVTDG